MKSYTEIEAMLESMKAATFGTTRSLGETEFGSVWLSQWGYPHEDTTFNTVFLKGFKEALRQVVSDKLTEDEIKARYASVQSQVLKLTDNRQYKAKKEYIGMRNGYASCLNYNGFDEVEHIGRNS